MAQIFWILYTQCVKLLKKKLTERHVFEMELFELLRVKMSDIATSKLQADVAAIHSQMLISMRNFSNVKESIRELLHALTHFYWILISINWKFPFAILRAIFLYLKHERH